MSQSSELESDRSVLPRAPTRSRLRRELARLPQWRFVAREEFERLAVSPGPIDRADDFAAGLRGLRDRRTGITFAIAEEALR